MKVSYDVEGFVQLTSPIKSFLKAFFCELGDIWIIEDSFI